jgi:hypothetical protein
MTSDEQEAQSRKYSDDVVILLPLSSGKVAVFNNARQLERIVDPPVTDLSVSITHRVTTPTRRPTFNPEIELDL